MKVVDVNIAATAMWKQLSKEAREIWLTWARCNMLEVKPKGSGKCKKKDPKEKAVIVQSGTGSLVPQEQTTGATGSSGPGQGTGAAGSPGLQEENGAAGSPGLREEIGAAGLSGLGEDDAVDLPGLQEENGATGSPGLQDSTSAAGSSLWEESGAAGAPGLVLGEDTGAVDQPGLWEGTGAVGSPGVQEETSAAGSSDQAEWSGVSSDLPRDLLNWDGRDSENGQVSSDNASTSFFTIDYPKAPICLMIVDIGHPEVPRRVQGIQYIYN
ncbi:hypothetical protein HWV62_807 [Athelia sp. TMB]|nr:hypothetical protein HWV62_807 [Athelia sp. TMB]